MKKLTQEEVILRFRQKHGTKYDYSKIIYLGMFIKVIIICPTHGEFLQTPNDHLNGSGCNKCKSYKIGNQFRFNIQEFIEKARIIHGYFYDYSKVNYVNALTKISIICPIHGEFNQTPASHLSGCGCPKCKFIYLNNLLKSNLEEFIKKAQFIHNDKYDYSLSIYTTAKNKITIICPYHGEFKQTPNDHLNGKGCPKCNYSKGETALESIFIKNNIKYEPQYKLPFYNYEYDFHLPDYGILVEFHGQQHYEPVDRFGGLERFKKQLDRDAKKRSLAREYNTPLIEIHHKYLDHKYIQKFEQLFLKELEKQMLIN